MTSESTVYEGWIYGVGEWQYSKVKPLLANAFETVKFEYLEENTGAIYFRGDSSMFEEDEENLMATFDLVADQVTDKGKGRVLATTWNKRGTVDVVVFDFKPGGWDRREISLDA